MSTTNSTTKSPFTLTHFGEGIDTLQCDITVSILCIVYVVIRGGSRMILTVVAELVKANSNQRRACIVIIIVLSGAQLARRRPAGSSGR